MKKYFIPLLVAASSAVACTEIEPTSYDKGLTLSSMNISFIGDGESQVIKITTTAPWELDLGDCDWLSASKTSGEATEKVILTAEKNPSSMNSRTVTVSCSSGGRTQSIEVNQERFMSWVSLDRNGETYQCDNLKPEETIELNVSSNFSWTVTTPEWVKAEPAQGEGNTTVTLTVDNSNVTSDHRRGTVVFSTGEEESDQTFTLEQVCSYANTYIVKSAGTYSIPAGQPDGTPLTNAASADWLYYVNCQPTGISYADGRITFTLDKTGGYAVIVLKNASNEVIWSYTIWATEAVNDVKIGNDIWMDRNIGAWTDNLPVDNFGGLSDESAYGCYYQWGRKDPMPGPKNEAIAKSKTEKRETQNGNYYNLTATIDYTFNTSIDPDGFQKTENNPITVDYITSHPWLFFHRYYYTNTSEEAPQWVQELWSDSRKTIYDPCPAGYKVPSKDQTNNMINTLESEWRNGDVEPFSNSYSRVYTSSSGTQFSVPCTSYREWGHLTYSGRSAGYWTCTYDSTCYSFCNEDFNKNGTAPDTHKLHNRSFAVRCVKIQSN